MPCYTDASAHVSAVQAAVGLNGLEVPYAFEAFGSSLLAKGFNSLWARALAEECDAFAMLHSDVIPQPGWAQTLLELLQEHDADLVSCIVPVKNHKGYSSCAIGDPDNPWTPLFRFTMSQLVNMPASFTATDVGWPGHPLLINTGCWIANLKKPWVHQRDEQGVLKASFAVADRITYRPDQTPRYVVESESEDWRFSRILWELGCKVMATRTIALEHYGTQAWPNQTEFGRQYDELLRRPSVLAKYGVAAEMAVHAHGYWTDCNPEGHRFDQGLATALKELDGSILDLGCGSGRYVHVLSQNGRSVRGVDGNPRTPYLAGDACTVCDLAEPAELESADWVLCLEVAEHVPQEHEEVFLDNIACHARRGAVLSWAIPGQPGRGHVNCCTNEHVIQQMAKRRLKFDPAHTAKLRQSSSLPVFRETLMSFQVDGSSVL
jgi:hypothetical protein